MKPIYFVLMMSVFLLGCEAEDIIDPPQSLGETTLEVKQFTTGDTNTRWVYLSFAKGDTVPLSSPTSSQEWDVAFRRTTVKIIRDWPATEIPGGIPSVSGWHKLTLELSGNQIKVYYDDQLLPGSPFTDAEADSGYFGIYCFTGFDTQNDSATFFDDVLVTAQTTSVSDNPSATTQQTFQLLQNYPNPFNPATTIPFVLDQTAEIRLEVLNLAGQHVALLASGRWPSGTHRVRWDAIGIPSGAYLIRLQASDQALVRRMLLVK